MIKVLATTGMTVSEITTLQEKDIKGTIRVRAENTKNNQERRIPITKTLARQLAGHLAHKKSQDYVFSTRQSPQLTTRRIEQIFKDASKEAGVNITPKDLRTAYLQQAANTTKNEEELRKLTGLTSVTKKHILSQQEQKSLLSKAAPREQALISLLLETGIKATEALALTEKKVSKTHIILPNRTIPLTPSLSNELQTLAQPGSHLFSTRQSTQLTPRRAEQLIKEVGKDIGLDVTPTLLRNTAITQLAQKYGVEEAQRRAGIKTPLTYKYGLLGGGTP